MANASYGKRRDDVTAELSGKRVELLKKIIPGLTGVAVLWNSTNPGAARSWAETRLAT